MPRMKGALDRTPGWLNLTVTGGTGETVVTQKLDPKSIDSWKDDLRESLNDLPQGMSLEVFRKKLIAERNQKNPVAIMAALMADVPKEDRERLKNLKFEERLEELKRILPKNMSASFRAKSFGLQEGVSAEEAIEFYREAVIRRPILDQKLSRNILTSYFFKGNGEHDLTGMPLTKSDMKLGETVFNELSETEFGLVLDKAEGLTTVGAVLKLKKAEKSDLLLNAHEYTRSFRKLINVEETLDGKITLKEVPPSQGIFRSCVGDDCATRYSFPFPNDPHEKIFFILDADGHAKGYLSGTRVIANGKPYFYAITIAGPKLDSSEVFLAVRGIQAAAAELKVEGVIVPERHRIVSLMNHAAPQEFMTRLHEEGGKRVKIQYRDPEIRSVIEGAESDYNSSALTDYDHMDKNNRGLLLPSPQPKDHVTLKVSRYEPTTAKHLPTAPEVAEVLRFAKRAGNRGGGRLFELLLSAEVAVTPQARKYLEYLAAQNEEEIFRMNIKDPGAVDLYAELIAEAPARVYVASNEDHVFHKVMKQRILTDPLGSLELLIGSGEEAVRARKNLGLPYLSEEMIHKLGTAPPGMNSIRYLQDGMTGLTADRLRLLSKNQKIKDYLNELITRLYEFESHHIQRELTLAILSDKNNAGWDEAVKSAKTDEYFEVFLNQKSLAKEALSEAGIHAWSEVMLARARTFLSMKDKIAGHEAFFKFVASKPPMFHGSLLLHSIQKGELSDDFLFGLMDSKSPKLAQEVFEQIGSRISNQLLSSVADPLWSKRTASWIDLLQTLPDARLAKIRDLVLENASIGFHWPRANSAERQMLAGELFRGASLSAKKEFYRRMGPPHRLSDSFAEFLEIVGREETGKFGFPSRLSIADLAGLDNDYISEFLRTPAVELNKDLVSYGERSPLFPKLLGYVRSIGHKYPELRDEIVLAHLEDYKSYSSFTAGEKLNAYKRGLGLYTNDVNPNFKLDQDTVDFLVESERVFPGKYDAVILQSPDIDRTPAKLRLDAMDRMSETASISTRKMEKVLNSLSQKELLKNRDQILRMYAPRVNLFSNLDDPEVGRVRGVLIRGLKPEDVEKRAGDLQWVLWSSPNHVPKSFARRMLKSGKCPSAEATLRKVIDAVR